MLPHPFTNFKIQKYYQNEPKFNGVYSRDNLPYKIKYRTYVINLDEYADAGTHWIALYVLNNDAVYFHSFGVETFLDKLGVLLVIKICKQTYSEYKYMIQSVMCSYFCIGFIDHTLAGKTLIDYTSLFSSHDFKKIDKIILSNIKNGWCVWYVSKFKRSSTV